jgi:hypothetical protein
MTTMIRKQLYLGADHEAALKDLSRRQRRSEADVVREAVAEYTARVRPAPAGDPAAWAEALAFMRSLAARRSSPAGRARPVPRERLYAEVLRRGRRHTR